MWGPLPSAFNYRVVERRREGEQAGTACVCGGRERGSVDVLTWNQELI